MFDLFLHTHRPDRDSRRSRWGHRVKNLKNLPFLPCETRLGNIIYRCVFKIRYLWIGFDVFGIFIRKKKATRRAYSCKQPFIHRPLSKNILRIFSSKGQWINDCKICAFIFLVSNKYRLRFLLGNIVAVNVCILIGRTNERENVGKDVRRNNKIRTRKFIQARPYLEYVRFSRMFQLREIKNCSKMIVFRLILNGKVSNPKTIFWKKNSYFLRIHN